MAGPGRYVPDETEGIVIPHQIGEFHTLAELTLALSLEGKAILRAVAKVRKALAADFAHIDLPIPWLGRKRLTLSLG